MEDECCMCFVKVSKKELYKDVNGNIYHKDCWKEMKEEKEKEGREY